jgi:hypothetical protein
MAFIQTATAGSSCLFSCNGFGLDATNPQHTVYSGTIAFIEEGEYMLMILSKTFPGFSEFQLV